MSIARVPGYSLLSNLDRQGIDLQFTTTGNTLAYMDFTNFRFGINNTSPTQALDVTGNARISGNLLTASNVLANIGTISNWYHTLHANSIISSSLTGVIQTAVQPNITRVGTLSNLTVSGNVVAGNISVGGGINISGNISVNNLTANTYTGNIITANQPFITTLSNISLTSLTASGNISANWLASNSASITNIYGTIQTANQPFITNLGNINVTSITIGGNVSITGNTNGGTINANLIYENGFRVLTSNTNVIITGDATSSGNVSNVRLTLANTGVTAGTYGAATVVPTIVVDSKGRITSASNVTLTKVGNVTVNDTTLTTTGNITLRPSSNIVDVGNSRIANVAAPTANTDAVNLTYLNSALSAAANLLTAGDSVVRLTDTGTANLSTVLDNTLTSVSTSSATTFYHAVTAGQLTINGNTISSTANIRLDTPSGIVQILGTDAVGLPAGGTGDRPGSALVGYTRFNTDTSAIETWDGNAWTSPGVQTITSETINPDGVSNTFALSSNVNSAYGVLVSINGTLQQPVTAYDVVGNQISFTEIPQNSDVIEIRTIAAGVTVSALQYGATEVQLTTGNVNVTGNLLPTANVTYGLGNEQYQWKDLWVSSNTVYIGGSALSVVDGQLSLNGSSVGVTYGNSNVASYLTTHTGNITAGNILASSFRYSNGVSILEGITNEFTSNAAFQAGLIASANTAVATANTAMKGYVDGQISSVTSAWQANAAVQAGNIATLFANAGAQAGTLATIQSTYAQISGATFTGNVTIPTLFLTNALAVSQGGTGATTTSGVGGALDNLLPSGEQSGYVLKTSGAGTYFWGAEAGSGGGTVGQALTTLRQANTATSGQTVFNLVNGLSYTPGTGQLRVYINGVRQFPDAYTETSNVSYTLDTGVSAGTVVFAEIDAFSTFNNYANLTYASNIGNIAASGLTVQSAIESLEASKAPLASPVFTGTLTAPLARITNSTQSSSPTTGALVVTGGVGIGGNLNVSGNLNIAGNVTYFSSNDVVINDAMIYLADDNTGDVLDIGIVSSFTDAVRYQHTGLVRDASDGQWKLFANVVAEPTTTVDFTNATYSNIRVGVLTASSSSVSGNVSAAGITAGNITASSNISVAGDITQNGVAGGIIPRGGIIMWSGSIAGIPTGWALCNGTNGTPDLRDRFVIGAGSAYSVAATGGSKDAVVVSHSHTATSSFSGNPLASHTHIATVTDPGHSHTLNTSALYSTADAPANNPVRILSGDPGTTGQTANVVLNDQNYINSNTTGISVSLSSNSAGTPSGTVSTTVNTTGVSGTNANLPPYYALAYIMKL